MDDVYFKRTLRDVELYSKQLNIITARARELGLGDEHVSVQQAVAKVDAAVREYLAVQIISEELGYKSIRFALKALSQIKQQPTYDLSQLPETFHKIPLIWLEGKAKNRIHPGFPPLTRTQAERAHRVILPLLLEAWDLAKGDEIVHDEITKAYLSESHTEFEKDLYKYIYELEDVPLHVQLEEAQAIRIAEKIDYENARDLGKYD